MSQKTDLHRYLCFTLGAEHYAVELLSVIRVIGFPELTPMPQTPPYFLGITNLRGDIIPVIDLAKKMGVTTKLETSKRVVIIAEVEGKQCGFTVDEVSSVLHPTHDQLSDSLPATGGKADQFMKQVIKTKERLVVHLELAKVFGTQDLAHLKSAGSPVVKAA